MARGFTNSGGYSAREVLFGPEDFLASRAADLALDTRGGGLAPIVNKLILTSSVTSSDETKNRNAEDASEKWSKMSNAERDSVVKELKPQLAAMARSVRELTERRSQGRIYIGKKETAPIKDVAKFMPIYPEEAAIIESDFKGSVENYLRSEYNLYLFGTEASKQIDEGEWAIQRLSQAVNPEEFYPVVKLDDAVLERIHYVVNSRKT